MDDIYFLADIFNNVDIFLLILVRIFGFFIILPILAGANVPATIRAGFACLFAYMVYFSGIYGEVDLNYYNNLSGYFFLIIKEFLVGFTMAYVIYLVFSVMYIVGHFIDDTIGFSMVSVFDPVSQIQVPITGNLLYLFAMALLIVTGGLNAILAVLFQSFEMLPIGQAVFLENENLTLYVLSLTINAFYMGIQIAMPIVGALMIINISLGILVKASPQMNVFVVGMPFKLLVGLILFFMILPIFANVYDLLFDEAYKAIVNVIRSLSL